MELQYHRQLLLEGAPSGFSQGTLNYVIVPANLSVDLDQFDSALHFDNCTFALGSQVIQDHWTQIESGAYPYYDFGRLTHTVQDFYAHSNWIELHQDVSPIPVWDLNPATLPADIVSGVFSLDSPKLCGPGAPTHEELNKDSPNSPEGSKVVASGPNAGKTLFDLAFATALQATKNQFAQLAPYVDSYNSTAYIYVVNNFSSNADITLTHAYSNDKPVSQKWTNVAPGKFGDPALAAGYNTGFIRTGMDWWSVTVVVTGGKDAGTWVVKSKECMLRSADDGARLHYSVSPDTFLLTQISGSCSSGWDQKP